MKTLVRGFAIIYFFLVSMPAFCNIHYAIFVNHTDISIAVDTNVKDLHYTVEPGGQVNLPGWRDDHGWATIYAINGHAPGDGYFSFSYNIIQDTAQVYTIVPGPTYGNDFIGASNRVLLDQDNQIQREKNAESTMDIEIDAINSRAKSLVDEAVSMKASDTNLVINSDLDAHLNDSVLIGGVTAELAAKKQSQSKLLSNDDFYLGVVESTQLGNMNVIRVTTSNGKALSCSAQHDDGSAYLILNNAVNNYSAVGLLAAANLHNPVKLTIGPGTETVDGIQSSYCIISSVTALS